MEKYQGIWFNNYITNEFTLNNLLGDHPDYINARKIIREERKNWTNEDYMNLLLQDSRKKKAKDYMINQIKMEV